MHKNTITDNIGAKPQWIDTTHTHKQCQRGEGTLGGTCTWKSNLKWSSTNYIATNSVECSVHTRLYVHHCVHVQWMMESTTFGGSSDGARHGVCTVAGRLLLEFVVLQGSLDGVLCQH